MLAGSLLSTPALPTQSSSSTAWYALKVRTRSEHVAAAALSLKGFVTFWPTYWEQRRYCDRRRVVKRSVFPGYVFCEFTLQDKVAIVTSPAVEYIVGIGGHAKAISKSEIECIRRVVAAGAEALPYLDKGRRVRIETGQLAGVEGVLARDPRGDKLVVSVDLIRGSVAVHLYAEQITLL